MAEVKVAANIAPQDIIDNETLNSINDNHAYIDIIELRMISGRVIITNF